MAYSAAQTARLLKPVLVSRARVPSLTGRVTETEIKRRVFKVERRAVLALADLYRAALNDLRAQAEGYTPTGDWLDGYMRFVRARLTTLGEDAAASALKAARLAYVGGYYGRLWALEMQTRPDTPIARPAPRGLAAVLDEALYDDAIDDLIRSLLGKRWRAQFADQLDVLIPQIRVAISQGMTDGEGIDAIMRRVRTTMGVTTDRRMGPMGSAERAGYKANFNRVQVITRTVVNKASNTGAYEAYQANADVLSGYQWLAAPGACPECAALNGTTYSLNDTMRPPRHPNCILPGNEVVLPGDLVAAAKSFYSGPCVEVRLSNGRSLRVTPNHPILTTGGWVRAQFIRKGAHVVGAKGSGQRIANTINPDNDHAPSLIEQVFSAFEESRTVATRGMEVTSEDFYGDARFMDRYIDVVDMDGELLGHTETAIADRAGKNALSRCSVCGRPLSADSAAGEIVVTALDSDHGSVGVGNHIEALIGGGLIPPQFHAGAPATGFDTRFQQSAADNRSRKASVSSELFFADAGQVAVDQIVGNWHSAGTDRNTGLLETVPDDLGIDFTFAGEFLDRFASEITFNEVVEVAEFDFTGHVYDLQVEPYQLYICNGVVVKNCRCTVIPSIRQEYRLPAAAAPRETWAAWAAPLRAEWGVGEF